MQECNESLLSAPLPAHPFVQLGELHRWSASVYCCAYQPSSTMATPAPRCHGPLHSSAADKDLKRPKRRVEATCSYPSRRCQGHRQRRRGSIARGASAVALRPRRWPSLDQRHRNEEAKQRNPHPRLGLGHARHVLPPPSEVATLCALLPSGPARFVIAIRRPLPHLTPIWSRLTTTATLSLSIKSPAEAISNTLQGQCQTPQPRKSGATGAPQRHTKKYHLETQKEALAELLACPTCSGGPAAASRSYSRRPEREATTRRATREPRAG